MRMCTGSILNTCGKMAERKSKTLFVRNLPFTTSNTELTKAFEDVGPVKTAFVVADRESGKCKGYGYIQFSMIEDAAKALQTVTHCSGRKIFLTYADTKKNWKVKHNKNKKSQSQDENTEEGNTEEGTQLEDDEKEETQSQPQASKREGKRSESDRSKKERPVSRVEDKQEEQKTLQSENSKKKVKKSQAQEKAKPNKTSQAQNGTEKTMETEGVTEQTAAAKVAAEPVKTQGQPKALKRCRLIVRNLSFKCKEPQLREKFAQFGDIAEVTIPLKNGQKSRGFGFVQFTKLQSAQKAVSTMNGQEILGRPVAVDWAVAKDRFLSSSQQETNEEAEASKDEDDKSDDDESDSGSEDESEADDDSDQDEDKDSSEEESDEDDEEEDSNDEEEEDSEDDDEEESSSKPKSDKKQVVQRKSDVDQGRTLFMRNIPFDAEEEDVEEVFQAFGELTYVRLVMDKVTGQPRGSAFVQFKKKEDAEQCLSQAQEGNTDSGLVMRGRQLLVTVALSQEDAKGKQTKEKNKEQKDNRNLFLAREGLIRAGTQAAVGMSEEDVKRRMKIEVAKREKLKNINIFISSTRLCIHNLLPRVDEKELKKVLRETVSDSSMKITECRVMRDLRRTNQEGVSKSLGFAFVNFSTHEHALQALRGLNNSTVFGDKKRPIAEFSLENRKALETKQKRLEKSKAGNLKRKDQSVEGRPPSKKLKPTLDKTQDRIAKTMHSGAPKGMPKRLGPKVRHRDRGQQKGGKKQKMKMKQNKRPMQQPPPKTKMNGTKKKQKKKEVTDKVDRLINKHQGKKNRWFESA